MALVRAQDYLVALRHVELAHPGGVHPANGTIGRDAAAAVLQP